jgi:alpha-L-fucosidase
MADLVAMARELQPGLIVANRTVGDIEDFVTPEREIPEGGIAGAWEACLPLAPDWKYVEGQHLKPAEAVFAEYQTIRARGGNFLMGVGPMPSGELPPEAARVLREFGEMRRKAGI